MLLAETVMIKAPLEPVYEAFADLERWKDILPDVLDVQVLYFDGYNQEFTMTVERPAGPETVRGIRYCRPYRELELFQPVPPPGLKAMRGTWVFYQDEPELTRVVASRSFILLPDDSRGATQRAEREEQFAEKLRGFLSTNLRLFKQELERNVPHRV